MTTKQVLPMEERGAFPALQNTGTGSALEEMNGLNAAFDRIKIPIGGVTHFEIPSDDPESPDTVKEFSAVILYHHPMRSYYATKYTGGTNPPDCGSLDGILGTGTPGGVCQDCLFDAFGSGENNAKACKEKRRLYVLREGELFPELLSLPTGSLRDFTRYLMRCIAKWGASNAGVTRFSLAKAVNKGGIAFTKAQFKMERKLSQEETDSLKPLMEQIKAISRHVEYDTDARKNEVLKAPANEPQAKEPPATEIPLPTEKARGRIRTAAKGRGAKPACSECGLVMTEQAARYSERVYGRTLCEDCQKTAAMSA